MTETLHKPASRANRQEARHGRRVIRQEDKEWSSDAQ
jgi:hypothetical protein